MFVRRRHRPRATLAGASARLTPRRAGQPAPRLISWTALALLTVGSVGNLGSASALAVVGLASVFLYVLPALVFLVPVSLVAAELASGWPGGVYNWVSQASPPRWGCSRCGASSPRRSSSTLLCSPMSPIHSPIPSTRPGQQRCLHRRRHHGPVLRRRYLSLLIRADARGQARVARDRDRDADPGRDPPWARRGLSGPGAPPGRADDAHDLLPAWNGLASIVLVVNSFFAYAGVEVNAVHVNELKNPAREYPRSIFVAMALVLAVFVGPTLAISWVIPSAKISFTVGVMQAFSSLFNRFGLGFAVPVIAIALAVGALAGTISWLDGRPRACS